LKNRKSGKAVAIRSRSLREKMVLKEKQKKTRKENKKKKPPPKEKE